ncbi:MAG TPA: hypothetical protein VGF34_14165 [Stellaceae bacterium]
MARLVRPQQDSKVRRFSADVDGQVEASKARLASSRRIGRQTEMLIRESQDTIKRSRVRLDKPEDPDKL